MGCIQIIGSFMTGQGLFESTKLAEKAIINYIQMGLFYKCAPPYLFACSLPGYEEERGKDLWKIVGDLPTASCDSLPRPLSPLWWCLWRGPLYDPRCDSSDALSRIFTCLMEKKEHSFVSHAFHSATFGAFLGRICSNWLLFCVNAMRKKDLNRKKDWVFHYEGCQNEPFWWSKSGLNHWPNFLTFF